MSTPTASPAAPAVIRIPKPSALKTCDRCGAEALWELVTLSGLDLLFCGHHAVKAGIVKFSTSHLAYQGETRTKGDTS